MAFPDKSEKIDGYSENEWGERQKTTPNDFKSVRLIVYKAQACR